MSTNIIGSLSLIVWLPIFFGIVVLMIGQDGREQLVRWVSLVGSILGALVLVPVWTQFDQTQTGFQFVESMP